MTLTQKLVLGGFLAAIALLILWGIWRSLRRGFVKINPGTWTGRGLNIDLTVGRERLAPLYWACIVAVAMLAAVFLGFAAMVLLGAVG